MLRSQIATLTFPNEIVFETLTSSLEGSVFFISRKKKETKKTHHESQLQIFFSHKPSHFLAEKFAVRAFRGRQPHVLRL
jgi:hypothetical protein